MCYDKFIGIEVTGSDDIFRASKGFDGGYEAGEASRMVMR